ncbi:ABC transporter ATP-binding protein [Granulicatella sp. WM01]|nr:ABC transporter ATP-binding protein [Granulicatella sp. WM01]
MLLEVKHVQKVYASPFSTTQTQALKDINFSVSKGEYVVIMGESGSGKTTLLNILATFDKATNGEVILSDTNLKKLKDTQLASFRRNTLGFVFQEFNLLDTLNIKDNILLPLVLSKTPYKEMSIRLAHVAKSLGIDTLLNKYPYQLSGGQKQRVAIARAIITNPILILADEPTGSLDSKTTDQLLDVFDTIHQSGHTLIVVTHSIKTASRADRVLFIKDGVVFHELYKGQQTHIQMYQKIADALSIIQVGEHHD